MLGLNGYPCTKGLHLVLNDSSQSPYFPVSFLSFSLSLSHPLLCLLSPNQLPLTNDTRHLFDLMLTRSTHNNDMKGLRALRNTEMLLSETEIRYGLGKVVEGEAETLDKVRHAYNMDKEDREMLQKVQIITEREMDTRYFGLVVTLEEDICDSREVEFIRA